MVHHANDDTILGKAYDGRLVRRLAKYVMPYWRQFSVAILLLIGAILSDLLPPLLLQRAIDGRFRLAQLMVSGPILLPSLVHC